jgi:hypothetical protein
MSELSTEYGSAKIRDGLCSVTPSTYGKLRQWSEGKACALQLLWQGPALLAPSPAAKLGDIVHELMERATSWGSRKEAESLWDTAMVEVEEKLSKNWTTSGLVPLNQTARKFELKRLLTLKSIGMVPESGNASTGTVPEGGQVLKEEEFKSVDGLLKGRVDRVEKRPKGWVLTDFKSGDVREHANDQGGRIKEEYRLQILLYACLLKEARNIMLEKAVLKTIDGREHPVDFDQADVEETGNDARDLLSRMNTHANDATPEDLSSPMPATYDEGIFGCSGCLFRPACRGYKAKTKEQAPGKHWPKDAWGGIISINRSAGRVELEIKNENNLRNEQDQPVDPIFQVSLEDSTVRHPALKGVEVGDPIAVYDFLKSRSSVAQDGPRTCIYPVNLPASIG